MDLAQRGAERAAVGAALVVVDNGCALGEDRPVRRFGCLALVLIATLAAPTLAHAQERVTVSPGSVAVGQPLTIRGSGWPVIEFCSRNVRLSLRGGQQLFGIGTARTNLTGRFRFPFVPRNVGVGFWRVIARMRCESGKDGSPVIVRASAPLRVGRPSFFCSLSGDFCYGIRRQGDDAILRLDSDVNFGRYNLCVTAPDGTRECERFRLGRGPQGLFRSRVRWSANYPDKGAGVYRVRWRKGGRALGPRLSFRRPTLLVSPRRVRRGGLVRVHGAVFACQGPVTLISNAFLRRHLFAGVPAVSAPVRAHGAYSVRIRIPAARRPGVYTITGRCGGGNLGVRARLRVLP